MLRKLKKNKTGALLGRVLTPSMLSFYSLPFNILFCLEISTSPGVRQDLFKAMLRQNIEWFDHPTNSVGALMTMLGMDASTVQNMTGQSLVGLTILGSFFAGTLRLFCPMTFQLCYLFVLFFSRLSGKKKDSKC